MRKFLILMLLGIPFILWGCSDSDDGGGPEIDPVTPEEAAAADSTATEALSDLMDEMEEATDGGIDIGDLDDLMEMDLSGVEEGADAALELDPNCVTAHFVMSLLELFFMAQDEGLQDVLADFGDEFDGVELPLGLTPDSMSPASLLRGGVLGHSFQILNRAPLALSPQRLELAGSTDKAEGPLIRALQTYVHDVMLPATDRIVGHLAVVEANPDFELLIIDNSAEPDTAEIDLGEVYVLDSVVRALRAGLMIATAYDVEIAPDGDYGWITGIMEDTGYTSAETIIGTAAGDTLYLYDDQEQDALAADAIWGEIQTLMAPGSDFLTLWTNPWSGANAMQASFTEIGLLLDKLEMAYTFIDAETDPQDNDIIGQWLIAELDAAVVEIGGDLPEWIGTWATLPDVIAWVEQILAGPYTIPIPMEGETSFDLVVNVRALFVTPVADWKTKLPYVGWLTFEEWAVFEEHRVSGPYSWNPSNSYNATVNGEEEAYLNIVAYYYVTEDWDMGLPLQFLDGPAGDPLEGEFPYFPDYTLGGLFPQMDRDDWLMLLGVETTP